MEQNRDEASSPVATVEEIQRRLVRPLSLQQQYSQSSTSILTSRDDLIRRDSAQFDADTIEFQRKREVMNERLDDYLDPVLLSAICAKIGGKRRKGRSEMKLKEFELKWPIDDESKAFMAEVSRTKKIKEDVDLGKDLDLIGGVRDGDEDCDELSCTPFRCFERTVLKQFRGDG